MHPAIKAALIKLGIATNMTTEARNGPLQSDITSALSLFHYQGTSHTVMMVD